MHKPRIIKFDSQAQMEAWPDFAEAEIASGSRAQRGHFWIDDKSRGISSGIWEAEENATHWIDYPVNEFMIVLEGEVIIVEEARETRIGPGGSFVIPKGLRCRWSQKGRVRKFFVIFDDSSGLKNAGALAAMKIDPAVKLAPSTPPAADMLLSAVPSQSAHEYFEDATAQFTVGVWQTTGYHRKLIDFPRHELMHLLEGSVTMLDDHGRAETFKAGDTFFVPMGTPNAWKSEGTLKKIYCIFQPRDRIA